MAKKIIIFGAGILGKRALNYFGSRNIYCFADNFKSGELYCGKQVISFQKMCETKDKYDIVVAVTRAFLPEIRQQLMAGGINNAEYFSDMLSIDDFESDKKLAQLKNIYKGRRCFIIGNGPSLNAKDLDILARNQELSFGCNRIYLIFKDTEWRPDIYFCVDNHLLTDDIDIIMGLDIKTKIITDLSHTPYGAAHGATLPKAHKGNIYSQQSVSSTCTDKSRLIFSNDPSRCVCNGGSVVSPMLQWAIYMGITEIYLLGIDFTFNNVRAADGKGVLPTIEHFCKDYLNKTDMETRKHSFYKDVGFLRTVVLNGYKYAEKYSRENGVRIFNATRGGELEVFERVDFDSLF